MAELRDPIDGRDPALGIDATRVGHRVILNVSGELDIATADALRAAVDSGLQSAIGELWIDLTVLRFMDSSGLRAVLEAHRRLRDAGKHFAVVCPEGPVRRVFALAGVDADLAVYDDRTAANHG